MKQLLFLSNTRGKHETLAMDNILDGIGKGFGHIVDGARTVANSVLSDWAGANILTMKNNKPALYERCYNDAQASLDAATPHTPMEEAATVEEAVAAIDNTLASPITDPVNDALALGRDFGRFVHENATVYNSTQAAILFRKSILDEAKHTLTAASYEKAARGLDFSLPDAIRVFDVAFAQAADNIEKGRDKASMWTVLDIKGGSVRIPYVNESAVNSVLISV